MLKKGPGYRNKIFVGGAAILGIFAFTKFFNFSPPKTTDITPQNVSVVTLNPVGKSAISGTATLEDISGSAAIITKFENLPDDESITPAYIRQGTCNKPGPVLYKLTVPDAGEAETDLEINVATLKSKGQMLIDLEKSLNDKTVLACGEINN